MKRRIHRGARGAALIESLVVISIMILFFLGMVFFEGMYEQKLRAMNLARAATVAHAINACAGSPTAYIQSELNGATSIDVPQNGAPFDLSQVPPPQLGLSSNGPVQQWLDRLNLSFVVPTEMDVTTHSGAADRSNNTTLVGFHSAPSTASFALCGDHEAAGNYEDIIKNFSIHDAFPF